MKRRNILKLLGSAATLSAIPGSIKALYLQSRVPGEPAGLKKPASVYISWASHDELSDNVPLTEELAMKEFDAMIRLKEQGVQFDYYLTDMFWFDKEGGFREFKKAGWPNGPEKWINACKQHGIKPGLWLPTNITGWTTDPWMNTKPEWKSSGGGWLGLAMSLHTGGFLDYHIQTMQEWYDKGIRMFKFDFADFSVNTKLTEKLYTPDENTLKNEEAWLEALRLFRYRNPEVVLLAYNGYGGDSTDTHPFFRKTVRLKWLEVFDSLYCGDPRAADVPCMNFWRSKDIYSDHMVFQYLFNHIPPERIDNTAFMIGTTGTCYYRKKQAWKGMLILSAARGGWMNTYYGNLDLLSDEDGRWFARVQRLYYELQEYGRISTFGNIPGSGLPYGFFAENASGSLTTVVNPSQEIQKIELPETRFDERLILFTDSGFEPELDKNTLVLGPEQMAVVGFGSLAAKNNALGKETDVVIPLNIRPLQYDPLRHEENRTRTTLRYEGNGDVRIVFTRHDEHGKPVRISGGAPPDGRFMADLLAIKVTQEGKTTQTVFNYNKQIWSGLSWAVAEVRNKDILKGVPLEIDFHHENVTGKKISVAAAFYEVFYS